MRRITLVTALLLSIISFSFIPARLQQSAVDEPSITLLVSEANIFYYYEGELKPDGSNFHISQSYMITDLLAFFNKRYPGEKTFILKIQKEDKLTPQSKDAVKQILAQKNCKRKKVSGAEAEFIKATEAAL